MYDLNFLINERNNDGNEELENLCPVSNFCNYPIKFTEICSETYEKCEGFQVYNETGKLPEDYINKNLINVIIMKI